MEFAAIIQVSVQVTEDHWELQRKVLKLTGENTIGDINRWYRSHIPKGPIECNIVDMETPEPEG